MGRKSLRDEVIMTDCINLAWRTILRAMNSPSLSEKDKLHVALQIAPKSIPKEHKGSIDHIVNYMTNITRDEPKQVENVTGQPKVIDVSRETDAEVIDITPDSATSCENEINNNGTGDGEGSHLSE